MSRLAPRLETIPVIAGRVHGAAQLASAMQNGTLLQVCPAAFTLPLGIQGGAPDAAAGMFRQSVDRLDGVLLVTRAAGDATGARALAELEPLIEATIAAIAGWGPDDLPGVYRLAKGELVGLDQGLCRYQLDFAIEDQLRIAR